MTDLFANFTKDSDRVLTNARHIAKSYKQNVITSEHLLLGVLQLNDCQAEQVLAELKANPAGIKARLQAYIKLQAKGQPAEAAASDNGRGQQLSVESAQILTEAIAEANEAGVTFVDTRLLVLGMLRTASSAAGKILAQHGVDLTGFRAAARLEEPPVDVAASGSAQPLLTRPRLPLQISPIFIGLVIFTAVSAYLTYAGVGNSQRTVFLFVTGGWLISLALHEFGHALAAFWSGDSSVVDKGYLTLNPLKYTHPFLSIVLPMLFLVLGGIGLPGGAVYVNRLAIRKYALLSVVSAAGPLATTLFGLVMAVPFIFNWHEASLLSHGDFWAGLAFLILLQVIALLLNLLPIPGLDGFGIVEPFLPPSLLQFANAVRPFGLFILIFLFFGNTGFGDQFWGSVGAVVRFLHPDLGWLGAEGYQLFRFWTNL